VPSYSLGYVLLRTSKYFTPLKTIWYKNDRRTNVIIQWSARPLYIQEVQGSNLCLEIDYPG
jgi:hypothetical protein